MNTRKKVLLIVLLLMMAAICLNPGWAYRVLYLILGGVSASGWYAVVVTNSSDGDVLVLTPAT